MDQAMKPATSPKEMEGYASCFLHLHNLWKSNHRKEYADAVQHKLASAANPYKLCLVCIKLCPDLYRNKNCGMAANMVVELQSFLKQQNNTHYSSCLTEDMQKEVFHVAVKQKNAGMMRLLVKAYQLRDIREQLIPHLHSMINQQHYKDVCTLVTLLDLQNHFTTEELIIPLFCTNRLFLANEYLDSSPTHQKELALFIDSVIGKEPDSYNILKKHNITDVNRFKTSKVLSTILTRLLKRYQLDMSVCPHLYRRRAVGGLRYLFYKHYIEKELQTTAFHSLVEDALKESPELRHNLMSLFCEYCDPQSAVPYVNKFHLRSEEIPQQIMDVMVTVSQLTQEEKCPSSLEVSQEEFWDLQEEASYSLSVSFECVTYVDTVEKFEKCMEEMSDSSVIGLDSEWKPTFGIGNAEHVALMQLATFTHVYLVDIISLCPLLDPAHWIQLGHVFTDINIIKLGYGIKCDFKILAKLHPDFKKAIASPQNVIDLDQKKSILLETFPEIFSYSASSVKGLSDLVYRCFGKPLNKSEQFSNWTDRPLSRQQQLYAAIDARCLIDIYDYLNTKSQELGIGDWLNIKHKTPSTKPKSQKKCKKVQPPSGKVSFREKKKSPITAKDFHVVCDTMLQGLAKKLRLCGIDAVALENGQNSDCCIDYFEKEQRIVMSRGAACQRLSKFIPAEFLCHIESEGARNQLNEVMETFNVRLSPTDIFARCTKCNSGSYLTVSPSVIGKMKNNETLGNSESLTDAWVTVKCGKVNVVSGLTMDGIKVKHEKVLMAAIAKAKEVYICSKCGKCYWEGSHQERAFRDIITPYLHCNDMNSEKHCSDTYTSSDSQILDMPLYDTDSSKTTDDCFENNLSPCSVTSENYIEKQMNDLSLS